LVIRQIDLFTLV